MPEEVWATRQAIAPLSPGVRWTDWGTPERVIATLLRLELRPGWLEALPRHLDLRSDARAVAARRRETSSGR
jgi:hypothetical protein